ncbi:efflux RND transporter periplasmic adaptor subunit [Corallincola platygyrae]|uniref:Efflux RND transporter periplasmic adaptor subunit n=1 Tax=Corallincola platygyrae TaxID=1193278 RepID=A0ABW4XQ04_9GAMM
MRSRLLPALVVIALSQFSSGCGRSSADEADSTYLHQVAAFEVQQQLSFNVPRQFVGLVSNNEEANVGFEQAGKIATLHFNEGDRVKAGDLLATLDTELLAIQRQELQAQVAETQAEIELADANFERLQTLAPKGYASAQSLDEITSQKNALKSRLSRLKASLAANQSRLNKSELAAPFDAIVNKRLVSRGEVVMAGSPAFELLQQGGLEVKVGVPVRLLPLLDKKTPSLKIQQQEFPATLLTRGGQVDPVSRTVQLRYALPDDASVVNGQLAYLALEEKRNKTGFWIPLTALTDGIRGMWNVYLLVNEQGAYRLEKRDVTVLFANETQAYVAGALSDKDKIVAAGLHRLAPGQQVRVDDQRGASL